MVGQAGKVIQRWKQGKLPVMGSVLSVETLVARLQPFLPLVEGVIQQTKQRVFRGNRHVPDKVLSLF